MIFSSITESTYDISTLPNNSKKKGHQPVLQYANLVLQYANLVVA